MRCVFEIAPQMNTRKIHHIAYDARLSLHIFHIFTFQLGLTVIVDKYAIQQIGPYSDSYTYRVGFAYVHVYKYVEYICQMLIFRVSICGIELLTPENLML